MHGTGFFQGFFSALRIFAVPLVSCTATNYFWSGAETPCTSSRSAFCFVPYVLLSQDFDEKRLEWRKQKKSVINAIGSMTARTLRFEDKERKTIALHALAFYKVCCRPKNMKKIDTNGVEGADTCFIFSTSGSERAFC